MTEQDKRTNEENEELELNGEQLAQLDAVYNAAFELIKALTVNPDMEWDMYYIGEVTETTAELLLNMKLPVRYPAVVTEEDGSQHIEDWLEPEA